jgi:hypothetical protein
VFDNHTVELKTQGIIFYFVGYLNMKMREVLRLIERIYTLELPW